ncbi:MAG: hypothetical protein DRP87_12590 [Spirochaetes bacterium]|nr:MAG: hypothetical protein DRP87_12590 [Spirochaetota bacterium]
MSRCYFCGQEILEERITRSSVCSKCGRDLKICLHCKFYKPGAHWDCWETITEPVREKDKVNFCDYFVLNPDIGPPGKEDKVKGARARFESLFKDE